MNDTPSFGYWIRRRRKALDLTQDELARRADCSLGAIRKLEADERRPSREIAERLAQVLKVPLEEHAAFLQVARAELALDRLPAVQLPSMPDPPRSLQPVPAPPVLPTGTVTFLLTDIEGSTALWEQHRERMRQALIRHDALVEQSVTQHDGQVVRPRGEGDSRFAVFARASDAVAAAATLQQALHAEPWPTSAPLKVRIAIHTGEADLREGDYYGGPVNRCARLRATAHGGQILVSQATSDVVQGQLPADMALRDLGEHRLKDLSRPERIFQLVGPNLPLTFAPLHSLDVRRHNLPVQRDLLLGREREVGEVVALLRRQEVGLLTLSGPGGTGKTRLSLQVAAELLDDFPDGVWFVDLAPIRDPELLASTIAHVLSVTEAGGQALAETLKSSVREKHLLLVLDNFEQIVPAASLVAELLAAASQLKVLVTSRETLHLHDEHEYPVAPLALPDPRRLPEPEQLSQYAAVALFIQRAQAAKAHFQVTKENATAVAQICVRLDGLPLALELAAARVKLLPPAALLTRLGNRLNVLTGGGRDLTPRQQTLRGAIDWSYNLLDPAEQMLFARLAVFVGGWTLEAAEVVCGDAVSSTALMDLLQSLLDKSLVQQTAGEGEDHEPRFGMLETIHEYALEQLSTRGELHELQSAHAAYYLTLAESAEPGLWGMEQVMWGERLTREHDNLRAAVRWFITRRATEQGLRMGGVLWRFWEFCGHALEGRALLTELLALPGGDDGPRAKALLAAGWLALMLSDGDVAAALCEQSAALYREVGDRWGLAFALSFSGYEMSWSDQRATESAALFEELGEPWGLAFACVLRSELAAQQGDARGRSLGQEGGRRFRELGDRWFMIEVLRRLSSVAERLGDRTWQTELLDELLRLTRDLGDTAQIAGAIHGRAMEARWQGDDEQAASLYDECVRLFRELGDNLALAAAFHGRGMVAYHQGDDAHAQALFEAGLSLFRQAEHQGIGWCFAGLAGVAGRQGQPRRAARLLGAGDVLAHFDTWRGDSPPAAEHREIVVTARTQLDAASWNAAWAEGRALTLEQAVAYALSMDDGA